MNKLLSLLKGFKNKDEVLEEIYQKLDNIEFVNDLKYDTLQEIRDIMFEILKEVSKP